jgi:type I restriction enzyme S subunit
MNSNWRLVAASDIIEFNPRESIPKGTIAKKVPMEKLLPFTRDIPEFEFASFSGGAKFRNGDTLMARITPCLENGKTAQVNIFDEREVGFGSTEFIVLRAKPHISDENYIYYLSLSPFIRNTAILSMIGSSGRQRVQQGVLNEIEFLAPPLEEQIEIGNTLKILDDKIAINNRINDYLAAV